MLQYLDNNTKSSNVYVSGLGFLEEKRYTMSFDFHIVPSVAGRVIITQQYIYLC